MKGPPAGPAGMGTEMSRKKPIEDERKDLDLSQIREICKEYEGRKWDLLVVLQKIQAVFGYVPRGAFPVVAKSLGVTASEIFGVVTFYNRFHMAPRGKHTIRTCRGTACHFKGAGEIIEAVRSHLRLEPDKETSPDGLFSIEEVACLGACGIAPVMTIDEETRGKLTPEDAVAAIVRFHEGKDKEAGGKEPA